MIWYMLIFPFLRTVECLEVLFSHGANLGAEDLNGRYGIECTVKINAFNLDSN